MKKSIPTFLLAIVFIFSSFSIISDTHTNGDDWNYGYEFDVFESDDPNFDIEDAIDWFETSITTTSTTTTTTTTTLATYTETTTPADTGIPDIPTYTETTTSIMEDPPDTSASGSQIITTTSTTGIRTTTSTTTTTTTLRTTSTSQPTTTSTTPWRTTTSTTTTTTTGQWTRTTTGKTTTTTTKATSTTAAPPPVKRLIVLCTMSLGANSGEILITAKTQGSDEMDEIGFSYIEILKSSDQQNWSYETSLNNLLSANSRIKTLDQYSVRVDGGCYYKVRAEHYASKCNYNGEKFESKGGVSEQVIWVDRHISDTTANITATNTATTPILLTTTTTRKSSTTHTTTSRQSIITYTTTTKKHLKPLHSRIITSTTTASTTSHVHKTSLYTLKTTQTEHSIGTAAASSATESPAKINLFANAPKTHDSGAGMYIALVLSFTGLVIITKKKD